MKSMTDHVGKHYDGLRPSVDKKKATQVQVPIQRSPSSPRLQHSPSAASIRNESLQLSTQSQGIQSGAHCTSTPLTRSAIRAKSITSTMALPLNSPPHSIPPPGIQEQEPDDNSNSGMYLLFSAELSTPKSDDNKPGMDSLFSAEFSLPESPSSPKLPLHQTWVGLSSNVNSEVILLSPLAYAKSNSIVSHPENQVCTFSFQGF